MLALTYASLIVHFTNTVKEVQRVIAQKLVDGYRLVPSEGLDHIVRGRNYEVEFYNQAKSAHEKWNVTLTRDESVVLTPLGI